jgi:ABC-type transport system involved in multi-copper enzyme maturation permease subunit
MNTAPINFVWRLLSLSWLTGPIFGKELRVASRRRRNYVLRSLYLLLFSLFLAPVWVNSMVMVYQQENIALYASRMAEAGRWITLTIVWFQFCAIQLVALVILSTAISDEIYHRTLGALMTTPINSFQIVMGKLFSRLLQLIILLAISLPLLAIVRVFGGVSWGYVISSLCITLTTAIFVGSLSLFFSILNRRAYVVIILTAVTIGVIFALLPLLTALVVDVMGWDTRARVDTLASALLNSNPYVSMFFNTLLMIEPPGGRMPFYSWYLQCGIILAASVLILSLSIKMVRRAALRQATGQLAPSPRAHRRRGHTTQPARATTRLRRIHGSPIIWKELRVPLLRRHKIAAFLSISCALIALFFSYALFAAENALDDEEAHMLYGSIFMGTGIFFTIVLPSTCITSEKEARSWPLLLATTLSDAHILWAKVIGAVRRTLPAWLFLFGHLVLFALVGYIHPIAIGQMAVLVISIVAFLSCTGIYFSSRFKRTTTAVIMNFALAAAIWAVVPLLLIITHELGDIRSKWYEDLAETYFDANPFVQAVVVMDATADTSSPQNYEWLSSGNLDLFESTGWMAFCLLAYLTLGWLFAWRAKRRLRHNVF